MSRTLTIIAVAATGIAMCVAFVAFRGGEDPVPASAAPERLTVPGPAPMAADDGTPVPRQPESVAPSAAEPAGSGRWSECADAIPDELPTALDGLGEGRTPPIVATLSASGSAEHVLAGALLRPEADPDAIRADIERALQLDGDHPLVLWHAVQACHRYERSAYCSSDGFRKAVFEHLGGNSAFWASRAVHLMDQADETAALYAMQRAAAAPDTDSYYGEHVLLFERALSVSPDMGYGVRVGAAIGIAAMVSSLGSETFMLCEEQSQVSDLWRDACTDWAEKLVAGSGTVSGMLIGRHLLKSVHERAGREDLASLAHNEIRKLRALVFADSSWQTPLMADERLLTEFVDELTSRGEIAAIRFAMAEADRLAADPGYDPCALIVR